MPSQTSYVGSAYGCEGHFILGSPLSACIQMHMVNADEIVCSWFVCCMYISMVGIGVLSSHDTTMTSLYGVTCRACFPRSSYALCHSCYLPLSWLQDYTTTSTTSLIAMQAGECRPKPGTILACSCPSVCRIQRRYM